MKWIKKTYLQSIPLRFGVCLSFYCFFFFLALLRNHCYSSVIERSEGWSLWSVGVLDQSQEDCRFFSRNSNQLQIFQIQPKRETSSSSLGDRLEKRSIISPKKTMLTQTNEDTWIIWMDSLPADVLWGSFVTHYFWQTNPKGRLRGG